MAVVGLVGFGQAACALMIVLAQDTSGSDCNIKGDGVWHWCATMGE